jgi:hypothetical protein
MDEFLKTLRTKERELELELSLNPLFKKLEGIRSTIALFESGEVENGQQPKSQLTDVPLEYSDQLSWRQRLLFVVNKLKNPYSSEIIAELKKLGAKENDEFLIKRVGVMLSSMKKKRLLGVRTVGNKFKYFIK